MNCHFKYMLNLVSVYKTFMSPSTLRAGSSAKCHGGQIIKIIILKTKTRHRSYIDKLISPNFDDCMGCCSVSGLTWGLLMMKLYQNFGNNYV